MNDLIDLLIHSHIILPSLAGVGIVGMTAYLVTKKKKKKKPAKNQNEGTEYYTQDSLDYDQTLDNTMPSTDIKRLLKPDLSTDFQDTIEEENHQEQQEIEFDKPSNHKAIKVHPLNEDDNVLVNYDPDKDLFATEKPIESLATFEPFDHPEENFFNSKEFLDDGQNKSENTHNEFSQFPIEEKHDESPEELKPALEEKSIHMVTHSEEEPISDISDVHESESGQQDNRLSYQERIKLLEDNNLLSLKEFVPVELPPLEIAQEMARNLEQNQNMEKENTSIQEETHESHEDVLQEIIPKMHDPVLEELKEQPVEQKVELPVAEDTTNLVESEFNQSLPVVAPTPAFEPHHFEELEKVDYHDYILAALNFDKIDNKIEALSNLKEASKLISNKKVFFYFKMAIQSYENATTNHKLPEIIDHFYYMEKQKLKQDEKAKFESKAEKLEVKTEAPKPVIQEPLETLQPVHEPVLNKIEEPTFEQKVLEPLEELQEKSETHEETTLSTSLAIEEHLHEEDHTLENSQTHQPTENILEITQEVVKENENNHLLDALTIDPVYSTQEVKVESTNLFAKETSVLPDSVFSQFGEPAPVSLPEMPVNLDKLPVLTEVVEPEEFNFESLPAPTLEEVEMVTHVQEIEELSAEDPVIIEVPETSLETMPTPEIVHPVQEIEMELSTIETPENEEHPESSIEEISLPEAHVKDVQEEIKPEETTSHEEFIESLPVEELSKEDDSTKLFSAFQSFVNPAPQFTASKGPPLLVVPKTKYRVWVNWMTTANNQMDMRNNTLEIDNPWGSAKAVEEVHEQLSYHANKGSDGKPQFAVISVMEMKSE